MGCRECVCDTQHVAERLAQSKQANKRASSAWLPGKTYFEHLQRYRLCCCCCCLPLLPLLPLLDTAVP